MPQQSTAEERQQLLAQLSTNEMVDNDLFVRLHSEHNSLLTYPGGIRFAPGTCYVCKNSLFTHWLKTGQAEKSGCPICHSSFVD